MRHVDSDIDGFCNSLDDSNLHPTHRRHGPHDFGDECI